MTHAPDGPWYYQQVALGFNYRMTDIQAALGRSQLAKLDDWVAARHRIAARYHAALKTMPVTRPGSIPDAFSAYHLYIVLVENRREVFEALRAAQIGVNVHYIPVHLQPYYRALGFRPGNFPTAEAYYARAISLPMFPTLAEQDQNFVIERLAKAL
jgi:dTDP-4-amino-4,6-dideoxygalactose transaminase